MLEPGRHKQQYCTGRTAPLPPCSPPPSLPQSATMIIELASAFACLLPQSLGHRATEGPHLLGALHIERTSCVAVAQRSTGKQAAASLKQYHAMLRGHSPSLLLLLLLLFRLPLFSLAINYQVLAPQLAHQSSTAAAHELINKRRQRVREGSVARGRCSEV